ncbi:MAG: 2-C-methyl-D-erythritol 4-phosphate cytidylyltransferase [Defluviitaleaceae bacterium]|nr:2-C-methyl-D-erythritol 4-phosphate cytidylyltransferase [Defluviitaleaceae bacterium]
MKISIVIPASGAGKRLGGDIPKQFLTLGGEPILRRTLSIFNAMEIVTEIAVAIPEGYLKEVSDYKIEKLHHIVEGKPTRAESVYAALKTLDKNTDAVLVHDGVRPFVTPEIIASVAQAAKKHGASVACAPVTDTIKVADKDGNVITTPDRSTLWQAQTPQGFTYEIITRAYATAEKDGILSEATDDSALAERIGLSVKIVPSPPNNIKITTTTDLYLAKVLNETSKFG